MENYVTSILKPKAIQPEHTWILLDLHIATGEDHHIKYKKYQKDLHLSSYITKHSDHPPRVLRSLILWEQFMRKNPKKLHSVTANNEQAYKLPSSSQGE